ncbi:7536_t:CDS:2 [Paraglomus occultum]|uniref:7536_t:CDS:1 n=1 Tax=Paraglomus occultum TaxID=144539 RepID=A0A9N9F2M0_9GLOM|nr:7536_t:CDS:2 [Paraglomus occultum]
MSQWLSPPGQYPSQQPPYTTYPGHPPPVPPSNQYLPAPYQRPPPPIIPLTTAVGDASLEFNNFVMALRGSAGPAEVDNFLIYLDMLMRDCSQSNMQRSERRQEFWIKESVYPHILPLLRSAYHFKDNKDIQRDKVLKVISIWEDKRYFDEAKITSLREGILTPPPIHTTNPHAFPSVHYPNQPAVPPYYGPNHPPPAMFHGPPQPMPQSVPHMPTSVATPLRNLSDPGPPGIPTQFPPNHSPPIPIQGIMPRPPVTAPLPPPAPEKKYHELPAGLMVPLTSPENAPYTSIRAADVRIPPHRPQPTPELLEAVDKFYEGIQLIESTTKDGKSDDAIPGTDKPKIELDKDGWEVGFLDDHYKSIESRRAEAAKTREEARATVEKNRHSSYRHNRDGRGRRRSRERSFSRSRSSRSRSSSVSQSRSRRRRRHSYSNSSRSRIREIVTEVGDGHYRDQKDIARRQGRYQDLLGHARESIFLAQGHEQEQRYRSRSYSRSRSRSPVKQASGLGFYAPPEEGARSDKMISDKNVGFQMLKKLGWGGTGTGLGSTSGGIVEPIKGGEVRYGEQKYLGVGLQGDDNDIFDQYRKQKSYTYQRNEIGPKDKKPAGCFRCGKSLGHVFY